jgi:orotidine-5'-phosphate decarboxylase
MQIRHQPKIIVALDVDLADEALDLVRALLPYTSYFKVGPQLFLAGGPAIVSRLREEGAKIFLDLKFHDIPSTVLRSARSACRLRPTMFDVHALAGKHSMRMAVEAAQELPKDERPLVLAISLLVSHDASYVAAYFGTSADLTSVALHLAENAAACGIGGIVCSVAEAEAVRRRFGDTLRIVCPGIRFADSAHDDYPAQRVASLLDQRIKSADYLVIGRPILAASDPVREIKEAQRLLAQI